MTDDENDASELGELREMASDRIDELEEQVAKLRDTLRWVRQTVHQGHHEGEATSCVKVTCDAIEQVLRETE